MEITKARPRGFEPLALGSGGENGELSGATSCYQTLGNVKDSEGVAVQALAPNPTPFGRLGHNLGTRLMTTWEVARVLGMDVSTVRYHAYFGHLPGVRMGWRLLFRDEDVERFIEARGLDAHPALLTTAQVAERLGVDEATVRRWQREGKLNGVRVGKDWRFEEDGLPCAKRVRPPKQQS